MCTAGRCCAGQLLASSAWSLSTTQLLAAKGTDFNRKEVHGKSRTPNEQELLYSETTSNKGIATSSKCIAISNKKLLVTLTCFASEEQMKMSVFCNDNSGGLHASR